MIPQSSTSLSSNVITFPRCRIDWRRQHIEGSLAAAPLLAPVIPILPALMLAAEHRATAAEGGLAPLFR